jgi:DNA-binding MarR family transcriptional regulator
MQDKQIESSLGYALLRAFRGVNRATNRAVSATGMTAEQAHILAVLWVKGAIKIGELQRIVALSSGTLTGAIDRMEKIGLVRRVPDPEDGRAWRVEPAPMPERKRRQLELILENIEETCFAALTSGERRQLLQLLEKVSASLGSP